MLKIWRETFFESISAECHSVVALTTINHSKFAFESATDGQFTVEAIGRQGE